MMSLWRHKSGEHVTAGDVGHSRYGTPLAEIIGAYAHGDPLKWLIIPTNWADTGGRCKGPEEWAEMMAPLVWEAWVELNPGAEPPDSVAVGRTTLELKLHAENYGGFNSQQPFD